MTAIEAFCARAEARAHLYAIGEIGLHEAVDALQIDAKETALVAAFGQDWVQGVIAGAFAEVRR